MTFFQYVFEIMSYILRVENPGPILTRHKKRIMWNIDTLKIFYALSEINMVDSEMVATSLQLLRSFVEDLILGIKWMDFWNPDLLSYWKYSSMYSLMLNIPVLFLYHKTSILHNHMHQSTI